MRTSRKKMLNVTCSEGESIRKKVDQFLSQEYQAWRTANQTNQANQNKGCGFGGLGCGTGATSNALIMDYVRLIYRDYRIADPMGGLIKVQSQELSGTVITTPKKPDPRTSQQQPFIKISEYPVVSEFQEANLRQSKIMEEGHARRMSDPYSETVPKKALFDSRQSTHHNHHRQSSVYQRETPSNGVARRLDDSTYGHFRGSQPIRQIQSVQLLNEGSVDDSNNRSSTFTPKQVKNAEQSHMFKFSRKINSLRKQQPIPQVFRYCIACQEAVLDANIETHERDCKQFSKVYELDLVGILQHLHKKIQTLKSTLTKTTKNLQESDYQSLQTACQVLTSECEEIAKTGTTTTKYNKNYEEAIRIGCKWATTTEQVNKLRWFVKVREEVRRRFDL